MCMFILANTILGSGISLEEVSTTAQQTHQRYLRTPVPSCSLWDAISWEALFYHIPPYMILWLSTDTQTHPNQMTMVEISKNWPITYRKDILNVDLTSILKQWWKGVQIIAAYWFAWAMICSINVKSISNCITDYDYYTSKENCCDTRIHFVTKSNTETGKFSKWNCCKDEEL